MPEEKKLLFELLETSGTLIRENINKNKQVNYKGEIDLVTEIDKQIEKIITSKIKKTFPNHNVLAEEFASNESLKDSTWIIDPIDGTTNFYHSYPHTCTSIAFYKNNEITLGGIYDPIKNELFFAEKNKGAFLNNIPIKVSTTESLDKALLVTGFPYDRRKKIDYYLKFMREFMLQCHGIRRGGSAALDLCYIASGRLDGYWEFNLQPWDVAAGALIVEEAGGTITNYKNNKFDIFKKETLATNTKIHEQMRKIILDNL